MKRLGRLSAIGALTLSSCSFGPERLTRLETTETVTVTLIDEAGSPVSDATFTAVGNSEHESNERGQIELGLSGPIAGVVTAPGKLPEPIAFGPRDGETTITLLDRIGPNGERTSMHFGGDTMLGQRYQQPLREDSVAATSSSAARAVVNELGPLSSSSDLTIVNLETVVGNLPVEDAYPGKVFLVQSPPIVTEALDEMGVDLVMLGNDHANDWQDAGVSSTLNALDQAGVPHIGAALDEETARRGILVQSGRRTIGVLSLTTLSGDRFNDLLPERGEQPAPSESPTSAWQYEVRSFGFGELGSPGYVATADRVASEIWQEFSAVEPTLSDQRVNELWAALSAPGAYPELQDWVARRGHGGAGQYEPDAMRAEIARLKSEGADVVVVQFHSGFQLVGSPSPGLRIASRAAIDAGADMVISHHPHVLQGAEWYNGKLIVYSLGNFVFDQNFHLTYPSAMLRVVVDDAGLVEARFLPIMLDRYRPVPLAGEQAERVVRMLAARSRRGAESGRVSSLDVTTIQLESLADGLTPAGIQLDRNTGLITAQPTSELTQMTVGPSGPATLPPCLTLRTNDLPTGVEYGLDLLTWGAIDDGTADRARGVPMHWQFPGNPDQWNVVQGASPDAFDDAIMLLSNANQKTSLRNLSLVPTPKHEIWLPDESAPADAAPSYSVSVDLRRVRGEQPVLRLAMYRVADEDLTRRPESTKLREITLPLTVPDDDEWHRLTVEIDPGSFEPVEATPVDAVFIYIETPPAFRGSLAVDNLRLYQWRPAPATGIALWSEADALRSDTDQTFEVATSGCESV